MFVSFTLKADGRVMINLKDITYFRFYKEETAVRLRDGRTMMIEETESEVKQLLNKSH